jgi:hypothetical protein
VNDIALELGVARSTAWNWVGHLPLAGDRAARNRAHSKVTTDARWGQHRLDRDAAHEAVSEAAARDVGPLSDRELLLIGAATLKGHKPTTNRRNTGAHYRGCLVIEVPRSRTLYWRIEGVMRGLATAIEAKPFS